MGPGLGREEFVSSPATLTAEQFDAVCRLLYGECGIRLQPGKEQLVQSRLAKRLRALRLPSFEAYFRHLENDASGQELRSLLDVLTTNKTSFFREPQHFEFLRQHLLPVLATRESVRVWTAGCSTGQEPYSLGMLLREEWPDVDGRAVRILATDLCQEVLARARRAEYPREEVDSLPPVMVNRYFQAVSPQGGEGRAAAGRGVSTYRVSPTVTRLVRIARLNLMQEWPMRGRFDVIFCRNVMIYFDRPTQERLIQRFYEMLTPGGHLFVGHSESLTSLRHEYRYVCPAVYSR